MPWNPDQYEKFKSERSAPFEDLLALVKIRHRLKVIDLGCGTGELTSRLADVLRGSEVTGLDNSPEMLGRAQVRGRPGLRFERGSIEEMNGKWDLIFSHAALQWVDDHEKLIPRLMRSLNPGGQLVVQVPSNHGHPAHILLGDVAGEAPYRSALKQFSPQSPVLSIDVYAHLLHAHGGTDLTVYEKIYPHVLPNADALAEWMAGTALVPYVERLPEALQDSFLTRYRERLRTRWPAPPVFYGFRRTLFAVARPD